MKQRFDSLDVMAMVAHVQRRLLGRRVVNIYDGHSATDSANNDTYLFKLDGSAADDKVFLCVQSGIRFHDVGAFTATGMPTPFCAKLRKHVRGTRLVQVQQIGTDRVVLFSFLGGQHKHFIILELYAKGNLILTDETYTIQALLRSHVYQDDEPPKESNKKAHKSHTDKVAVQVGHVYPVTYAADVTQDSGEKDNDSNTTLSTGLWAAEPGLWALHVMEQHTSSKKPLTLKTLLLRPSSGVTHFGPALIEHCILFAKLQPHQPLSAQSIPTPNDWANLQTAFRQEAPAVLKRLTQTTSTDAEPPPGYLIYEPLKENPSESGNGGNATAATNTSVTTSLMTKYPDKVLHEFQPHLLLQHVQRPHIQTRDFGVAVQDFFGQLQTQKAALRAQAATQAAATKLHKARQDQHNRLQALHVEQDTLFQQAAAVEQHATAVDQALAIINSALNAGMDWDQLEQIIQVEQENQNPIALLIQNLRLEDDIMTLQLPVDAVAADDPDVDGETGETVVRVDIFLKETAHANASRLFAKYRNSKEKAQKTIEAADKALKAAEETAQRQLADAQRKAQQGPSTMGFIKRKPFWFEKFHWFITSDNYLVVGGKDAHQNETLVKRYLRPGDAYLHADAHGAASCILRAKRRRKSTGKTVPIPLPEQALREAGNFTICHSSAWASRMVTSAYWVDSHQVSKTAPSGEYLTVGSFMVRGKKNFLPPTPLEMGLAVLFRLGDEESIARHQNERRDFSLLALEDQDSEVEDSAEQEAENENTAQDQQESTSHTEVVPELSADKPEDENDDNDKQVDNANASEIGSDDKDSPPKNAAPKKGLSARDRKLIKKYGSLEQAEKVLAARTNEDDNGSESVVTLPTASNTGQEQQQSSKRGKKGKMKRAKKKYADQDDEDRELAMLLLQGSTKQEKRKEKNGKGNNIELSATQEQVAAQTSAVLKKDVSILVQGLNDETRTFLGDCVKHEDAEGQVLYEWQKIDYEIVEQLLALDSQEAQVAAAKRLRSLAMGKSIENLSLSLAGIIRTIRKHGHEGLEKRVEDEGNGQQADDGSKKELKKPTDPESNDPLDFDIDDEVGDDTAELSKLTGKPISEDVVLFAMPVFAPYHTLSQYSFRVKLTPGNMKRGKAAKAAVEMISNSAGQDAHGKRLKDMIKAVSDNDWVQTLVSDVKISSAGASKVTKHQKAKAKKNKKGK